ASGNSPHSPPQHGTAAKDPALFGRAGEAFRRPGKFRHCQEKVGGGNAAACIPTTGDNASMPISTPAGQESARLTQYAHSDGKIPPGELEAVVSTLKLDSPVPGAYGKLIVGLDGDDAAVVANPDGGPAYALTTDFFSPVVDDAYDWG